MHGTLFLTNTKGQKNEARQSHIFTLVSSLDGAHGASMSLGFVKSWRDRDQFVDEELATRHDEPIDRATPYE